MVDGTVISQGQLSQELQWWASSRAYVQSYDMAQLERMEEEESQGQQAEAFTVEGTGSGPGDYGLVWASQQLANIVQADAVHHYLARHGTEPTSLDVAAAWAAEDAEQPVVWQELPAQLRDTVAERDAEHTMVEKIGSASSDEKAFYGSHLADFWSRVCVDTNEVTVLGPSGQKQAAAVAAQPEKFAGWASYCLAPDALLGQPASFRDKVLALRPGKASYIAQSYGYEVVQVRSRSEIRLDGAVGEDIYLAMHQSSEQTAVGDSPVIDILRAAQVEVNPEYGSWTTLPSAPTYPPVILPPGFSS
jgi:hypothetical protein